MNPTFTYLAGMQIAPRIKLHSASSIVPKTATRMMNRLFSICAISALSIAPLASNASHISGVDIEWECVGPNQFQIYLNIYRDCDGISMSATEAITVSSPCGGTQTVTLNQTAMSGLEISQLCPQDLPNSTCNGGTLPGMEHYIYSGIVTLNPQCDPWTISWDDCCRNSAISNLQSPGGLDMYAEAQLFTQSDSCNNSPDFTNQPIPYVCAGQPVFYNYGVIDPDGDSLVYTLISARETATQLTVYNAGYSAGSPIPGLTLNSNTGEVSFLPTTTGQFVVVVLVEEYDAVTGQLIGTVMRDMQFTVITCVNTVPTPPSSAINFSGTATPTGPFSFLMCVGNSATFDIEFTDTDPLDTLTLSSNVTSVLPGASFTWTGINPATATISWVASGNTATIAAFTVDAQDNACPVPGLTSQTVFIQIAPSVYAGPDILVCDGSSTQLSATGGTDFQWSVLNGPPMTPSNFSCDTCFNPIATPPATTTYRVFSNLSGQCVNADTVTIEVVPPFGFNNINLTDVTCNGENDGQIELVPFGTPGPPWYYKLYDASNAAIDSATTNGNHTFSGLEPGTYRVKLSENFGCEVDSAMLVINEPDSMSIVTGDTIICLTSSGVVSAIASGGNGGYSYTWNNNLSGNGPHTVSPMSTTYYSVFATDALGCTSPTDSFTVNLFPPLTLTPTWTDSICIDATATLTGGGSGGNGGPYTYDWAQIGTGSLGTGASISTTPVNGSTDYLVTMTDGCSTPAVTDTLNVGWYAPPQPLLDADRYEDCFPASINFFNNTNPSDVGSTCVWDFGDGNVVSGGCTGINHIYANVGCYDVGLTVYSPEGCPGDTTYSQFVCARPYPQAQFSFGPQPTNVFNTTISFMNESIDGVEYKWFFGENGSLGSTDVVNPIWTFPDFDAGTYPVWLYAENIYGCLDSIRYLVVIDGEYQFWVPNTFTPDGDALNDFFGVSGEGIATEEFVLQIFNRWGELIFESKDPNNPWDGGNAQQGVYAYRIEAVNKYSRIKNEYLGHVTLLR